MAYRTVLTITQTDLGKSDVELAATLCEEIDAHLSVLVVETAAPPPVGEYATIVSDAWIEERQADLERLQQRSEEVKTFLDQRSTSFDVSSEYPEEALAHEIIGQRAMYADIGVLGPELLANELLKRKAIEGLLFSSGKPLLLVPQGSKPTLKPKRVMVAWDSRMEASVAVSHALCLLTAADDVHVVLVDPKQGELEQGDEPGADIATYLARHGVKVTVDQLPGLGRSVADALRSHVLDTAADLLVMGAYGHSRMRERVFGGVTRSILSQPPCPTFLAH